MTDHGEYGCPSPCCSGATAEAEIARDVYGCAAGRHCTQATPEQRIRFDQQITERLAVREAGAKEAT